MDNLFNSIRTIPALLRITQSIEPVLSRHKTITPQSISITDLPHDLVEDIFSYVTPRHITVYVSGGGRKTSVHDIYGNTKLDVRVMNYSLIHPRLTPAWTRVFYRGVHLIFMDIGIVQPFIEFVGQNVCKSIKHVDLQTSHDNNFEITQDIWQCCRHFTNLKKLKLSTGSCMILNPSKIRSCHTDYARERARIEIATKTPGTLFGGHVAVCVERLPAVWIQHWVVFPISHRLKLPAYETKLDMEEFQDFIVDREKNQQKKIRAYQLAMKRKMTEQFATWKQRSTTSKIATRYYHDYLFEYTKSEMAKQGYMQSQTSSNQFEVPITTKSRQVGRHISHKALFWETPAPSEFWNANHFPLGHRAGPLYEFLEDMEDRYWLSTAFRGLRSPDRLLDTLGKFWTECKLNGRLARWGDQNKTFGNQVLGRDVPVRIWDDRR